MQKFDFTAPPSGAPQVVNVPGRYLKYVSGNAAGNDTGLIITPGSKPGSKILLYPGQAITLPDDGTAGPNGWTLVNAVGAAQIAGTVVIGNGRIDDNTLQGTVQVVDGGKSRTLAGAAYMGVVYAPATSTKYAAAQLWNPAANTKRLVIEAIQVSANAGAWLGYIGITSTQQTTLTTPGSLSKLSGGPAQSAQGYTAAAATAVTAEPEMLNISGAAGVSVGYAFKDPVVILPGYGLVVANQNVSQDISATFEWFEEPNV